MESLQAAMEEQRGRHSKELMKKDSEREIVSEELDSLTEQYQQLESAFESQSSQLSHSHSEVERLRRELETKTAELGKLAQQDKERRASISRVSPLWINVLLISVYTVGLFSCLNCNYYRSPQRARGIYSRLCKPKMRRLNYILSL